VSDKGEKKKWGPERTRASITRESFSQSKERDLMKGQVQLLWMSSRIAIKYMHELH